jgi:translocation and assembly module TamA
VTPGAQVPRSRNRRRAIALAVAVLLLLPAAILLLVRLPAVRSRVLEVALRRARESTGLSIQARGLSIEPVAGRLRLQGVVVAVPGARPFLEVAEAEVEIDTGEAIHRRLHLRRLVLRGVTLDLDAPLPASREERRTDPKELLAAFEIDELDVAFSSIASSFPPSLHRIALAARAENARVTGGLRKGALTLHADLPSVVVDRPGPLQVSTSGAFGLSVTPAGLVRLEDLRLSGEGLSATASGTGALDPDAPLALQAGLQVRPESIAPELRTRGTFTFSADVTGRPSDLSTDLTISGRDVATEAVAVKTLSARVRVRSGEVVIDSAKAELLPRGRVEATGRLYLSSGDGVYTLRAEGLPDDLLDRFLDEASRDRMGLAGSELDVVATVRHGRGEPLPLSADADLSLRRGELTLTTATVKLLARGAATLDVAATLLPNSPGERTASGRLFAPSLAAFAKGRLADGRLRAEIPDLAASAAELETLFPALVPRLPADVDLGGAFHLDVRAAGPLRSLAARVESTFSPSRGGALSLLATADAGRGTAEGTVAVSDVSVEAFRPGATGRVSADARFVLGPKRWDVRLAVDGSDLCVDESAPLLQAIHADLEADESELRVFEVAAVTGEGGIASRVPGTRLLASGRGSLASPLADADLSLLLSAAGFAGEAHATTRGGVLEVDVPGVGTPGLEAVLTARLPLGALRAVPALAQRLPAGLPSGPLDVTLDAAGLDSCALEDLLPAGSPLVPLAANVRGFATLDLADPLAGTAELAVDGLAAETVAGPLALAGPARLTLRGGRLALEELSVSGERTSFVVAAAADLVPGARPGRAAADLLAHVSASVRGRADAALLGPFLAGGAASGALAVDVSVAGPPDAIVGRVFLDGQGSRFTWPLAWPTEIKDPLLEADLAPGAVSLARGEALLNGGPVLVSGGWVKGEGTSLTALFADVRYRLAYGLAAILSGELTFDAKGGEKRVSGNVTLDRGLLERDVDLDREILSRLLAPPETIGTEASFLDTLALDVGIGTASGVRIRNNVADLSASWSRIDVTGTARRPVIRGRIDVESGGLVFAYGQTFRVDRGTVTYAGDPATDPRLDFVTTSSLQDTTIARRKGTGDVFADARASAGAEGEVDAAAELARGLAGYYGDRLASRLGAALGRVSLSIRPLALLGQADPTARLVLSRDFSSNVSLAVSFDLKNAQRQTWVVDVHGIRRLPPLAAQAFTEDFGRYGGILQQRIEIGGTGGTRDEDAGAPLLAQLLLTPPIGVSRRALLSATGLRRGKPAGRAALFEAEIDAEAYLRGRGWPDVQVNLRAVPSRKAGRVDVEASIDPGPRVEVLFEGDRLPAASRTAIAGLYRTGVLEAGALEEMKRETDRALRALGHVEPQTDVSAGGDAESRRVVVTARAGRKIEIAEVAFEGVSPREAGVLARRFASPLERVELAAALPSADRRLLEALHGLGYPQGRILDRTLSNEGRLPLFVEPGLPSLVDDVEVRGVPPEEAERLERLARLAPGEPADADRTALSALAMEDALRHAGFGQARVRAVLSPASPEDPPRLAVVFEVERGSTGHVGSVTVEGLGRTNARWARDVAGLAPGSSFLREAVDAARGQLFSLGLFRSVKGETIPGPDGRIDVVLTAEELPPLTLAYGVRWENERGFSAVVDAADRNVFGRGLTLGLRVLYDPDDRALRAFAGLPEVVLGLGVDLWAERRRTFRVSDAFEQETNSTEVSLQLSRNLARALSARLYGRWKETSVFVDDPFFPFDVTTRLPYAGAQLVWDTREDPLLGTRGVLASIDLQGSGGWLGSSFAFARAYGQVNLYRPVLALGAGRAVWAQSVRAGFARAFQGQELVPDVRFFAGGSYSVRGYRTESLGPQQDLGGTLFATGGSTLLVVNEELRVPLHPRLLGVGFFDAGQVWTSSGDFGTSLATSAGIGVRALTPVGVLRLDGAFPLNRREGDPAFIVTFGFGNVF